jgi:glucose-1-phosphate thymidylyltransferase
MKLILPIAGVGQRLRPFTFSKPKGFLKIGGYRVVDHILSKISTHTETNTPLAVIFGYKRKQIYTYLEEKYAKTFNISYINQEPRGYQGDVPYFGGLGEAIMLTRDWYHKTPHKEAAERKHINLVFLGDMIPVGTYETIMTGMEREGVDGIIGAMQVSPERIRFYGIIEADETRKITKMVEKPTSSPSTLAIAGVYAFNDKTMTRLYEILTEQYGIFQEKQKHLRVEFQFTPALQQLVDEGYKLNYAVFDEGILDFGQTDALLVGNRVLLEANQSTIQGAIGEINDSVIKNPSFIGTNTTIIRSIIGPNASIGENCHIENCNISDVVIGDNCSLQGVITQQSIIGDNAKVENIIKDGVYLGDNSLVVESKQS